MPRFSIVIPTKQRADTLRYSLETVLALRPADFEVVVQNNGRDRATEEVVLSCASRQVVYRYTDEMLPMSANWERALDGASGELVTFIGDDDGILPDACAIADAALRATGASLLMWRPHTYNWPSAIAPWARNSLIFNFPREDEGAMLNTSATTLQRFYAGAAPWEDTPMIYCAFVHRSLVEKVRARSGAYFPTLSPDIYSGIANLWASERYVRLERSLSVRGNSGHSTGSACYYGSLGSEIRDKFLADDRERVRFHPALLPTLNLEAAICNEQLLAKELLFPDDDRFVIRIPTVLTLMALNINRDHATYDATLAEIHALAARHGIDPKTLDVPPRKVVTPGRYQGPIRTGGDRERHITGLVVDGDQAGLRTIADAVRLAQSMARDLTGTA